MEENDIVVSEVAKLMEMGVYISLDDFGTGYSSMKYLKQFRVQALKIDRAFIDKVDKYQERAAIVRSIVHLAHGLGMDVVAEGVETAEEMKLTKEYGVNEIQGYYISKPLSQQEFQKLLQHVKAPGDSPPPS